MSWFAWGVLGVAAFVLAVGVLVRIRARRAARSTRFVGPMKEFHRQREYLEARFFDLASQSGKPRGLQWVRCDFEDGVAYARDRRTGNLIALVGVTIGFVPIEGGGMEDVPAAHDLRAATALFEYSEGRWTTQGRAVFNLNPIEAIGYYQHYLELVARQTPVRTPSL